MSDPRRFRSELDEALLAEVKLLGQGKTGSMSDAEKRHLRALAYAVSAVPHDLSGPADFSSGLSGYLDDHYYPEFGCKHGKPHTDERPGCSSRTPATWEGVLSIALRSEDHYRVDREWYDQRRAWLRDEAARRPA